MGEMISIPIDEYRALQAAVEDLADLRAYDRAKAAVVSGEEELLPADLVRRMMGGESLLRLWREHRGLSQAELARASGVNRVQIINIESGKARGSIETLRRLADALGVSLDDLV